MLILRPIEPADLDDLVALAARLDSVNLPSDRDFLEARIAHSERSFAGTLADGETGIYVFALEDTEAGRCVGTSMILAKHGTPEAPYLPNAAILDDYRCLPVDTTLASDLFVTGIDVLPGNVKLELGLAHFFRGGFAESAPNAAESDSTYFYTQAVIQL